MTFISFYFSQFTSWFDIGGVYLVSCFPRRYENKCGNTLYGVASVAPGAITGVADVVAVAIVVCVVIGFCQMSVGAVADDAAGVAAAWVGWLVGCCCCCRGRGRGCGN